MPVRGAREAIVGFRRSPRARGRRPFARRRRPFARRRRPFARRRRRPFVVSGAQPEPAMRIDDEPEEEAGQDSRRRSNRQQEQGSPKRKAPSAEQHSGERRWNPFRTKHLLDSVCEVVTSFSSEQWDAMLKAGWRVKDAQILDGAGYVLAPWLQNETRTIRELKGRTEGKDTGFWM